MELAGSTHNRAASSVGLPSPPAACMKQPVTQLGSVSYMYMRHDSLYLIATTRDNCNAALVFAFLSKLLVIMKSYVDTVTEDRIRHRPPYPASPSLPSPRHAVGVSIVAVSLPPAAFHPAEHFVLIQELIDGPTSRACLRCTRSHPRMCGMRPVHTPLPPATE
eukprot:gene7289-1302_t